MTSKPFAVKKQQCNIFGLTISWAVYLAGLIYLLLSASGFVALAWLVLATGDREDRHRFSIVLQTLELTLEPNWRAPASSYSVSRRSECSG